MKDGDFRQLLQQSEGPTLEFKREWYKIDDSDSNIKSRHRDELIKDILSLANGSPNTAGRKAYLIIGADEQQTLDGSRILHDIGEFLPDRKQILKIVSAACDPKLEDLEIEVVSIDGKRIHVLSVPPSPYLYETTRELSCVKSKFNEYAVFIRRGEVIGIASAQERAAILQSKQIRFSERRNAPPVKFGAMIGALVGGMLMIALADKVLGNTLGRTTGFFMGTFIFGSLGAIIGALYQELLQSRNRWRRLPSLARTFIILTLVALIAYWVMTIWTQIVH